MPDAIWSVLANRLNRYLAFGYITATVAGALLVAELVLQSMIGPPAHRRHSVAKAFSTLINSHANGVVILLITILAITIFCALGIALRFFTAIAISWLIRILYSFLFLTHLDVRFGKTIEWLLKAGDPAFHVERTKVKRQSYSRRNRSLPIGHVPQQEAEKPFSSAFLGLPTRGRPQLASQIIPILRSQLSAEQAWRLLTATYGEDRVKAVLAPHPISVPVKDDNQIIYLERYFKAWFRTATPNYANPDYLTLSVLASTFFIPTLLLPQAIHNLFGQVAGLSLWIWILTATVLLGMAQMMLPLFSLHKRAIALFLDFVTMQLVNDSIEHSPVPPLPDTESDASSSDSEKRLPSKSSDKSRTEQQATL